MDKRLPYLLALLVAVIALAAAPAIAQPGQEKQEDPFAWTNGYSMILTSNTTYDEANATVDFIEQNGGRVALIVSPRMLLGWASESLVGQHDILAVHTKNVPPGVLKKMDINEADHIKFFNEVASGAWKAKKADTYAPMEWHGPADAVKRLPVGGAAAAPGVSQQDIAESYPGTSDFMAGKVRYNVFFVESNGTIDANYYSWTCADLTSTVAEISAGLSFWSSKAATYGVPLSFSVNYQKPSVYSGTTLLCSGYNQVKQGYEPVRHAGAGTNGYDGDALWVNPIMCNYGAAYCSGTSWSRVHNYNSWSRTYYKTNWATSMFIAYNPSPAPTAFTNGHFAYSWVPNGPYAQLLFRNNGWATTDNDRITSHETGHLFGADDEYAASGCSNCTTGDASSKMVINGNCENCNPAHVGCMMNHNESALCGYTPGQLGWGLNITKVAAVSTTGTDKTNWLPGQGVNYRVWYTIPGKAGEYVTMRFRWYVQFENGVTWTHDTGDMANWNPTGISNYTNTSGTIPANAPYGEASVTIQMEVKYASGYYYGRGMRSTARAKMFILPTSANSILLAPAGPPVTTTGAGIQ